MEATGGDAASVVAPLAKWRNDFARVFQYYLDRSTPHPVERWLGTLVAAAIYILRVYYVQGFYIVSYGVGIYILNLLIGFLSPKVDPELEALDGASLPTKGSDEFRPFVRRLPEFKFW
ncbi:Protein RER1B [Morella rubra]|uniref:Protein RER1B n=1 Tax=Morella rubra TaxID=262757 RepID=A0A6A1W9D1_9ROSI|nr:Protein RER1B [Morella rubra]